MTAASKRAPATIADWMARPDHERLELVRGTLVPKAAPTPEHASTQVGASRTVIVPFQRRGGPGGPGGWWFFIEMDVELGGNVFRPDLCGYRRTRMPQRPKGERPVRLTPDWISEVLSQSNESHHRVVKMQAYYRAGVPHYWLIDPNERILEVYRRTDLAYSLVLSAQSGERVRAEPFDAVELSVDELLGDDPAED